MSDPTNTKNQNQRKQRNKHHYIMAMVEMPTDKAPKAYAAVYERLDIESQTRPSI
jgi:hypothetical protein